MQEDPNKREDEEREASDEPIVEGNRDDSVEAHHFLGQVDRVGDRDIRIAGETERTN